MAGIRAKGNVAYFLNTSASSSPVWTAIPAIFSIGGGGGAIDLIDVTTFDSAGNSREKIGGLTDPVSRTVDLNYIPGDTTVELLRTANVAGTVVELKLTLGTAYGGAESTVFEAYVTKFPDPTGPVEGKLSISGVEFTPTALASWT